MKINIFTFLILLILTSCGEDALPKPYGNVRLEYPEAEFKSFTYRDCPFTFEYSDLAFVHPKDSFCSENIYYPLLKSTIYLDYEVIDNNLIELIKDAEKSVYEPHSTRANFIKPQIIARPVDNVFGTLYELGGESAMNFQFHLTDSTQNFIRGSVYFNSHPKPDSLQPAVDYMKRDVERLMETLVWK